MSASTPGVRLPIAWALGVLLAATALRAEVLISEIRPWNGQTGLEAEVYNLVELYNPGPGSLDLDGYYLGSQNDAEALALPAWILPPGGFLEIHFESGVDDGDFSDGLGLLFADALLFYLEPAAGELAVYTDVPGDNAVADFVAWGVGGGSTGDARAHALADGEWTAGEYVELGSYGAFSHMGRLPTGYDTNQPTDWAELGQEFSISSSSLSGMSVDLRDNSLHDSVGELSWRLVPDATDYLLEVDEDSLFGSPDISLTTAATSAPVALGEGRWFWRVTPTLSGGPYEARVHNFVIYNGSRAAVMAPVPQRLQHKDSQLLCIWHYPRWRPPATGGALPAQRPGCSLGASAQGPWDNTHPATMAHIPGCRHCSQYCTRASIQMVNAKYGGSLSQDEISYKLKHNRFAGPEGDLGHFEGAWPQTNSAYSWAMNGAGIAENFQTPPVPPQRFFPPIPWNTLKAEIDAGTPVLTVIRPPGWFHTVVIDGYNEVQLPLLPFTLNYIHIRDPWPGRTGWYFAPAMPVMRYYLLPASGITGRAADPNAAADGDGDGVMNFDEGQQASQQTPRPFCCSAGLADSDFDQVRDKQEIRSYTFHDVLDHAGHNDDAPGFPDVDGDGLRAECDCDTDNDGDIDGGEDLNGDGRSPVGPGETCVYNPNDFDLDLEVIVVPGIDCPLEALLGGGSLHANSSYPADIDEGCDPPQDGEALEWDFIVDTDAQGAILPASLGFFEDGLYRIIIDQDLDGEYHDACPDAWTCFDVLCETSEAADLPLDFQLLPNRPNPFNPSTVIRFGLPGTGEARLSVYNLQGRLVRVLHEGRLEAGWHDLRFDGSGLASGLYLYRLEAAGKVATRRMLLLQ